MIYVDTSVILAYLFGEKQRPASDLWKEQLVTSRLTEYEVWTRVHAVKLGATLGETVRQVLHLLAMVELAPPVLARALDPFPAPVRTLDALHLASMAFLQSQAVPVRLAAYDRRLVKAAGMLDIEPYKL